MQSITRFIWLRQYLKLRVLAYIFCISKSTVGEEIYHVVPILFTNYRRFIKWHSIRQWNQFLDTFPSFPNAVGLNDGTIHQIRRPSGPLQAECYRGLPQIGHGKAKDLPRRARILADGAYAARMPVIIPRRIVRNRIQLQANQTLRSLRMQIEHSVGFQKVYASIIQ